MSSPALQITERELTALRGIDRRVFVAGAVSGALAIGSWRSSAAQAPRHGGTLNVGMAGDARSLDPTFQLQFSERQPEYLIYNTLIGLDREFGFIPELAEQWLIGDDHLSLTLRLRRDVRFHDGTAFDAESVKWNLERRMSEAVNSPSRTELRRAIATVDVIDPLTVRIGLRTPSPSLLGMLAQREGFMVSPAAATKFGDSFGLNPVGTGPFVFREWRQNDRVIVERNPDYWERGKPYLDRVVFHQLANANIGIPRLLTGELDILSYLSPNQVRMLEGNRDINLLLNQGARWCTLHMNGDDPPFNDVRVRQAIAYGLDREKLAAIATARRGVVANGPTPPNLWWFRKNLKPYPHDPDMAKRLLADAGYGAGLSLTLSTPPEALYRPISVLVQEQLAQVGISVAIEPVSSAMWGELAMNGAINFMPITWTQRPDPDGLLSYLLESTSSQNWVHFRNAEFDQLLRMGRLEQERGRRREIYSQAQQILAEELPYINLFFSVEYTAMRSNVQGFVFIPDNIPRFREIWKSG